MVLWRVAEMEAYHARSRPEATPLLTAPLIRWTILSLYSVCQVASFRNGCEWASCPIAWFRGTVGGPAGLASEAWPTSQSRGTTSPLPQPRPSAPEVARGRRCVGGCEFSGVREACEALDTSCAGHHRPVVRLARSALAIHTGILGVFPCTSSECAGRRRRRRFPARGFGMGILKQD